MSTDYLVNDNAALCHAAFDRGCLEYLAALIQSINPHEPASPEWEEDEPGSISCLREVRKKTKAVVFYSIH
jgi:armadillo repeat-containing protein 8